MFFLIKQTIKRPNEKPPYEKDFNAYSIMTTFISIYLNVIKLLQSFQNVVLSETRLSLFWVWVFFTIVSIYFIIALFKIK